MRLFWEWGFRAKESALMVFPKAQSYAFVILALGGLLYLCPALRQDHLLPGPSDSEIEGGLWPEGLAGEGGRPLWEEEQRYQWQNRTFKPGHRWRGGCFPSGKQWEICWNLPPESWNFLFLISLSNTYFEKLLKGGGKLIRALCAWSPPPELL